MSRHVCTKRPCPLCLIERKQPLPSYMLAEHRRRMALLTDEQRTIIERIIGEFLGLEPLPHTAAPMTILEGAETLQVVHRVALPSGGAILFVHKQPPASPETAVAKRRRSG